MMELSELFTRSARDALPLARAKKLISYFDYHGPYLELPASNPGLRAAIHRILVATTDCIDTGFVMFSAEVEAPRAGRSELVVHAAGTGTTAADEALALVMERLQLQPVQPPPRGVHGVEAFGVCPVTHGDVTFLNSGPEGLVISLRTWISGAEIPGTEPLPNAAGITAWLVSPVPGGLDSVHRRLRRLGWRVKSFRSLEQVSEQVDQAKDAEGARLPMLLITLEFAGGELAELERLASVVPAMWTVLTVLTGSPTLQARGGTLVDIRALPLSPLELDQFTVHVDWRTSTTESRETSPRPLYAEDAGLVLVVDDSPVNQLIARGQLELLGFEVAIASNGVEAIAFCRRRAPDMILMDIDMPVMGGMEATEQLRACQLAGSLPPFPILAATANDDASRRKACLTAGMDGYLAKPMRLHILADEIHRVLPARPVALG